MSKNEISKVDIYVGIFAIILLLTGYIFKLREDSYLKDKEFKKVNAIIYEKRSHKRGVYISYKFNIGGIEYKSSDSVFKSSAKEFNIEDTINIYYLPENPSKYTGIQLY